MNLHRKRMLAIEKEIRPGKTKKLTECSDEELISIIFDGWTGKESAPKYLTDDILMSIARSG